MATQSPFVRFKVTQDRWLGHIHFKLHVLDECHQTVCMGYRGKGTGHQNNRIQRLLSAFHFSCCSLPNAKGKVMPLFSILSRFIDPERS